jgi:hypothetical protein
MNDNNTKVCDYFEEDEDLNNSDYENNDQSEEVQYYKENVKSKINNNNQNNNNQNNNNQKNQTDNLDTYIKNNICYDSSDEEKEIVYNNKPNKLLESNNEFRKDITMDKLFDGVPMENYAETQSKYKPKKKLLNWFIKK